ncbi:TIR domain-containing protein [Sphingobacterium siyangense]|uniref:TIR domain-containing protein n=1 Tax=Sphingobacterium siyangense TaxID=459529 RepID=UPI00301951EF
MSNNIFISHYYKDDDKVQKLKAKLKKSGYEVRNFSVDSTKHKDGRTPTKQVIERYLRIRITLAKTFICVIGDKTHTRPWVDFEIKEAIRQGKQIIGIYNHGDKDKVIIPDALRRHGVDILGWNSTDKLGEIIENGNESISNPDEFNYSIQRVKC